MKSSSFDFAVDGGAEQPRTECQTAEEGHQHRGDRLDVASRHERDLPGPDDLVDEGRDAGDERKTENALLAYSSRVSHACEQHSDARELPAGPRARLRNVLRSRSSDGVIGHGTYF